MNNPENNAPASVEPITVWSKYNKKKNRYEHNHIEDGHRIGDAPVARSEEQVKAWSNSSWRKKLAYLKGSRVVE